MRSIAIINQKGGVGKTTTAVNLSAALAATGQRVCLVDMDPQAHATLHLGLPCARDARSMYDVLTDDASLSDVLQQAGDNLWVAGSQVAVDPADDVTDARWFSFEDLPDLNEHMRALVDAAARHP